MTEEMPMRIWAKRDRFGVIAEADRYQAEKHSYDTRYIRADAVEELREAAEEAHAWMHLREKRIPGVPNCSDRLRAALAKMEEADDV